MTKSLLTVALALLTTSAWADFTAQVNTNSVAVNDAFQLTLSSDDVSRRNIPDLTPLENDFKILGMSQSMQTHIVNGYTTRKHSWTIKLSPKIAGQLTIPPIQLQTALGIESTAPISLQSLEQGQIANKNNQDVSITASLDGNTNTVNTQTLSTQPNNHHYIFQEIPLTVRIESSQPVAQAELIVSDIPDVEIEQQGEDKVSQIIRNGIPITVIERQYILRPQKTGIFEIPPIVVKGNYRNNRLNSIHQHGFDEFFNRQFHNSRGEEFVAKTDDITLNVKANPNNKNEWFLPATTVEMFSEWLDNGDKVATPNFKVGEPITRQISLVAVGATPEQLPKLEIPEVDGVQFYIDSDKTEKVQTNKGIVARRVVSVSVVPEYGGTFTLPEITVTWQNTETDKAETAILPAEVINVLGMNSMDTNSNHNNSNEAMTDESSENDKIQDSQNSRNVSSINSWLMMAWLALGLLLFIMAGYVYRKIKMNNQAKSNKKSPHVNMLTIAENDIQQAIADNNIKQVYQALMKYKTATVTDKKIDHKKLSQIIEQLEQSLYGADKQVNTVNVFAEVSTLLSKSNTVKSKVYNKKPVTELPALYEK